VHRLEMRDFDTIVILSAWRQWKQRTHGCSGTSGSTINLIVLVHRIKEDFELWKQAARGGGAHATRVGLGRSCEWGVVGILVRRVFL
jgi:hypothetical protein